MDKHIKTAFITGLSFKPASRLAFSFLGRNYAPAYNACFGNAFSEGSSVQNEYGFFTTCEWQIIKKWRLNAYYDIFVFPWLKYGVNAPSTGSDYAIQATWMPSSGCQMIIRFKAKAKDKNSSDHENTFLPVEKKSQKTNTISDSVKTRILDAEDDPGWQQHSISIQ